jgi:hypothetical protein
MCWTGTHLQQRNSVQNPDSKVRTTGMLIEREPKDHFQVLAQDKLDDMNSHFTYLLCTLIKSFKRIATIARKYWNNGLSESPVRSSWSNNRLISVNYTLSQFTMADFIPSPHFSDMLVLFE